MLWDLQSDQSAIATLCKTAQPKISSIRAPFSATASRQSAEQGRRASGEGPCLLFPSCIFDRQHGQVSNAMASTLVTRNQFNITPQGIVHKPTEAGFIPHPGDPHSGIVVIAPHARAISRSKNPKFSRSEAPFIEPWHFPCRLIDAGDFEGPVRTRYFPPRSTLSFSFSFICLTVGSREASPVVWVVVAGGVLFGTELCSWGCLAGRVAVADGGELDCAFAASTQKKDARQ